MPVVVELMLVEEFIPKLAIELLAATHSPNVIIPFGTFSCSEREGVAIAEPVQVSDHGL